ncbi:MAG: hypothetical protein KGI37_09525 [Alphaproteobacteria bacterium]|nr:hypothetical protein [Alphaproteobacteria bacterium]
MNEQKINLSNLDAAISDKMDELILRRNDAWDFLETEHPAKDTEVRLKDIRAVGKNLSVIPVALNAYKKQNPQDAERVNMLMHNYEILHDYVREIQECLTRDYDAIKKSSYDAKIDYVKNVTFLFGLPIGFIASVKNGVGHGHISPEEAMVVGFAISIPTVFHKTAKNLFKAAAKEIYAVPKAITNDMRVVYAREIVKEHTHNTHVCFAVAAKSINDNVKVTSNRATARLRRLLGHGPKP